MGIYPDEWLTERGVRSVEMSEFFWRKRYYDHNVRSYRSFLAKLHYIHRNPVRRGFPSSREQWVVEQFSRLAGRVSAFTAPHPAARMTVN